MAPERGDCPEDGSGMEVDGMSEGEGFVIDPDAVEEAMREFGPKITEAEDGDDLADTIKPCGPNEVYCGGNGAIACKVHLLEQDLERFSEGMQGLVGEAHETLGGVFERISILHCRTSRIEAMLGISYDDDEEEEGSGMMGGMGMSGGGSPAQPCSPSAAAAAAMAEEVGEGDDEEFEARARAAMAAGAGIAGVGLRRPSCSSTGSPRQTCCRRGHPLERSSEDDPEEAAQQPRVCGFCRRSRRTTHQCGGGCYFYACRECVEGVADPDDDLCTEPKRTAGGVEAELHAAASAAAAAAGAGAGAGGGSGSGSGRRASGRGAYWEPETPSTDVPPEEDAMSRQAEDVDSLAGVEAPPLPRDGERKMLPAGPEAAAGGAGGPPVRVRLAALETEFRALERKLAEGPALSAAKAPEAAAPASLKELEQTIGRLVEGESARLREELREQLERATAETAARIAAECREQTAEECARAVRGPVEALRAELFGSVEERLRSVASEAAAAAAASAGPSHHQRGAGGGLGHEALEALRGELLGKISDVNEDWRAEVRVVTEKAERAEARGSRLKQECLQAAEKAGQLMQVEVIKTRELSSEVKRELDSFAARVGVLEADLPRGRPGAVRRGGSSSALYGSEGAGDAPLGATGASGASLEGLAQGVAALARVLGLIAEGEALGPPGADGWASLGRRFEKAWAARLRDFWQLGLPAKPHLFDLFRAVAAPAALAASGTPSAAAGGSGAGRTSSPSPLPDRREGARLATRLAAAVAFGSSGRLDEPTPAAAESPSFRRSCSGLSNASSAAPPATPMSESSPLRPPASMSRHGAASASPAQEAWGDAFHMQQEAASSGRSSRGERPPSGLRRPSSQTRSACAGSPGIRA